MIKMMKQRLNQKGFTLVELMVVIAILGILAAIAIPKFSDSTATANTAKIQADLRTIDAAIVMYQAQTGNDPALEAAGVTALKNANLLVEVPQPPTGSCFKGHNVPEKITGSDYKIKKDADGAFRASLDNLFGNGFKKTTDTVPAG